MASPIKEYRRAFWETIEADREEQRNPKPTVLEEGQRWVPHKPRTKEINK